MAKKSRKTAAKYSEMSKGGKKKQRPKAPAQPQAAQAPDEDQTQNEIQPQARSETVSVSMSRETVQPKSVKPQATRTVPRAKSEMKLAASGLEYARSDLKRIGILAGGMLVILIILAFVLG